MDVHHFLRQRLLGKALYCPEQKEYGKPAFHNGYNNGFIYITPEYAICNNPSANLLIILRNCNIIHGKVESEQYGDDGLLHFHLFFLIL